MPVSRGEDDGSLSPPPTTRRRLTDPDVPANMKTSQLKAKLAAMGIAVPAMARKDMVRLLEANVARTIPSATETRDTSTASTSTGGDSNIADVKSQLESLQKTVESLSRQLTSQSQTSTSAGDVFSTGRSAQRVASHDLPKVVCITPALRFKIQQGKFINIALLNLPAHDVSTARTIVDAEGNEIRIKGGQDERLNQPMTIGDFVAAFTKYMDIVCEVDDRREELHQYMADIVDMANQHGGQLFMDYHQAFFLRAATLLETYNTKVHWGIKDKNIMDSLLISKRGKHCVTCGSHSHTTESCVRRGSARAQVTPFTRNPTMDLRGRQRVVVQGKEICNNFNDEKGCGRFMCHFMHICHNCHNPHPIFKCRKRSSTAVQEGSHDKRDKQA